VRLALADMIARRRRSARRLERRARELRPARRGRASASSTRPTSRWTSASGPWIWPAITACSTASIEKIYRDARLTQIFEGTNQINRLAVIGDRQEQLLAEIVGSARPVSGRASAGGRMNTALNARQADPFFQVPQTTATTSPVRPSCRRCTTTSAL
jgi:hypothetical protein